MRTIDRSHEIETAASQYAFIRRVVKVDQTHYSVKYRLYIAPDLFVQLYFNERSGTIGMVLVHHNQRIYGRDCEAGNWHRHPVDDPLMHDTSPSGAQSVSVGDFLAEIQDILVSNGLI